MRDKIKQKTYFKAYLENEDRKIEKYKMMANKVREERGEDDEGLRRAYIIIQTSYFNKLNCLYSMGAEIEEIKKLYPSLVEIMTKVWNKESGYVRLLWMISIGIMLDIEIKYVKELENLVKGDALEDYLVDYLLSCWDKEWSSSSETFVFPEPYGELYRVINEPDKDSALDKLSQYLNDLWYAGHDDISWYDSHKGKNDTYNGYWCYESGALVKILKLDDSSLQNSPYYPYDMVNYK
ncbi:DUF1911 domain-containing protein [Listeria booriae]|uniref:DUF1911 domain-containing protein n=1 Tax=Listeria booriae TaxID=1552123 RepID=A0A099WAC5_9LIST|nr:PoNe immunity protein domain-containing protein [Listeria booriae]KGL42724.1 hypothetical protein EP57_04505 [Listeria booriae]MBC1906116.1 DUF1911 domain-containing protein [Listeria booriae]MBC2369346.1 DUF1911 domain-containing protein [Listeria booriae]STY40962.1 Domain of uncharacterised function (DUF1911) [Listeria booriae]